MGKMIKFILLCFICVINFKLNVFAEEPKNSTSQFEVVKNSTSHSVELLQMVSLAEGQNEGEEQVAFIMQTIINRVRDENFPNTIEEVISQDGQFSTYMNGSYYNYPPNEISEKALSLLYTMENKGQTFFCNENYSSWHDECLKYSFDYKSHIYYTL